MGALGALLLAALAWAVTQTEQGVDLDSPETQAAMLVMSVALLAFSLIQVPLGRRLDRSLLRATERPPAAFVAVDFLALVAIFIAAQVVVVMAYSWFVTGDPTPSESFFEDLGALPTLGLTAAGQAIPAAFVVLLALRRPGGLAALGVTRPTPGWRTTYALGRYVLALPMLFGLITLTSYLYLVSGMEPPEQDAALIVRDGLGENPIPIVIFVALVIPLLEEILFRGFLLELLVSFIGRAGGVVVSSALFGLMHGIGAFLPIFGLALVLAVVKLRTRSLVAAWFVHALHNGAMTLFLHFGDLPE